KWRDNRNRFFSPFRDFSGCALCSVIVLPAILPSWHVAVHPGAKGLLTQYGPNGMHVELKGQRKILCVFPRYVPSFGTFEYAYPLTDGVRGFMPPQGLLVIAAALPKTWTVRFVDENIGPASAD